MAARWITVAQAAEIMGLTSRTARRSLLALAEEHPKLLDRKNPRAYRVHRRTLEAIWLEPERAPDPRDLDLQARADRLERELEWLRADFRRTRRQVAALTAEASGEASAPPPDARARSAASG